MSSFHQKFTNLCYKMLTNILAKPKKSALNNAENNMKNVLERDDLPPDEKVKAFTKELNSLQRYRYSMIKSREPVMKEEKEDDIKAKDTIEEKKDSVPSKPDLEEVLGVLPKTCLLYTSPSPRDQRGSRMPSSA